MAVFTESKFPQDVTQKMLRDAPMAVDAADVLDVWSQAGLDDILRIWTPQELEEARELRNRMKLIAEMMHEADEKVAKEFRIKAMLQEEL